MTIDAYAVILAGGKGERFWPLSTSRCPKQFLTLVGEESLLAQAVDRLEGIVPPENVYVITNQDLIETAREAAPKLPTENIIGEPIGRDTAAAIALGAVLVKQRNPDAVFAVLTADHIIGDLDVFRQSLQDGFELAHEEEVLVTIGMTPTEPSTGYGYIEAGALKRETGAGTRLLQASRFVEKPDSETAATYVASGKYYWNSGMFIWSVSAIEKAFQNFRKPLFDMISSLASVVGTPAFDERLAALYGSLEKISIDYAVMEPATNVVMIVGTFAWDDVGSWPALEHHFEPDEQGNVVIGSAAILDAARNITLSKNHLTALIGVEDLIIVQAPGVTLVCPKDRAQDIKTLVHQIKASGHHKDLV